MLKFVSGSAPRLTDRYIRTPTRAPTAIWCELLGAAGGSSARITPYRSPGCTSCGTAIVTVRTTRLCAGRLPDDGVTVVQLVSSFGVLPEATRNEPPLTCAAS